MNRLSGVGWLFVCQVKVSCEQIYTAPILWMSCNSVVKIEGEGRRKKARQKSGTRSFMGSVRAATKVVSLNCCDSYRV